MGPLSQVNGLTARRLAKSRAAVETEISSGLWIEYSRIESNKNAATLLTPPCAPNAGVRTMIFFEVGGFTKVTARNRACGPTDCKAPSADVASAQDFAAAECFRPVDEQSQLL